MVQSSSSSSSAAVAAMAGGAGLRSRKVDHRKALAVYRASEIPDMDESVASFTHRTATQAARGVEKEEEEEHHLQVALNTNQSGVSAASVFIPTPDASKQISDYGLFYSSTYQQPKSLIKFSSTIDECMGCPYNMDDRDDTWLQDTKSKGLVPSDLSEDVFEMIMWTMERLANEKLTGECPSLEEYREFLEIEQPGLLEASACFPIVYPWWKQRRFKDRGGQSITPQLKYEDFGTETDPYVCFRRREVKTMRKTRRCDQQSLDKLRRLREEMEAARQILDMVSNRERLRKESLALEMEIFEERIKVRRMKKMLGIVTTTTDADASPEKSRKKSKKQDGPTKIKIPLQKFRDAVNRSDSPLLDALDIEERVKRKRLNDEKEGWLDFSETPYRPYPAGREYWTPTLHSMQEEEEEAVVYRRRMGRGGRMMVDRHVYKSRWLPTDPQDEQAERIRQQWRFDAADSAQVEEEAVELNENYRMLAYRAFHLAPLSEQECRTLMNKPSFPEQINVQPLSSQQRYQHILLQQQKRQDILNKCQSASAASPSHTSAQKKRASRPSSSADTKSSQSVAATKKKTQEPLDPRAAAVNAMVQQARKQAQANQLLFSNSPRPSTDGSMNTQTTGLSTSPPKNGTAKPGMHPLGIPMNANMMNMMAAATPQQRMRLNQLRMQQQGQAASLANGFPQNMAGLTPQQFQRLYYGNQQQQQQQLLMQQAALQNQMRLGMHNPMLMNGGSFANSAQLQLQMMQQSPLLNKLAPSGDVTDGTSLDSSNPPPAESVPAVDSDVTAT